MGELLELLEKIFEGAIPRYLLWALLVALLLIALLRSIPFLRKEIVPIFYSVEKARRRNRRQRFAEHIEHELRRLNSMEEWSDYRFTELEAEVETEGRRRSRLLPFLTRRDLLRRELSLTRALANSRERLILLEGAAGSGKSVALRHVALQMAKRVLGSHSINTVIPIYVNLKSLRRRPALDGENTIDAQLIRSFVLQSINRANDRDVASFLDDEFQVGLNNGLWLFLFDSFDEIPEILSSTEADSTIATYAQAISDFLHGMNRCRGILASREYRGPKYLAWSRFRIMPLSSQQQRELVTRAGLSQDDETKTMGGLSASSQTARHFIENPMFLSLLCEYVRAHHAYPEHDSHVYEAYLENRLTRDQERVQQRFGLSLADVRTGAESIAYCMLRDSTLGLSATRQDIAVSLLNHDLSANTDINCVLDALHFIKLGKVERESPSQEIFTFSHRRLQEHLAATLLLREPSRVTSLELLTNGVWRESAVVLLQLTDSVDKLKPIVETGTALIAAVLWTSPFDFEIDELQAMDGTAKEAQLPQPFPWPPNLLHVMALLQDGLRGRAQLVPDFLRSLYTVVVGVVWNPRKWLLSDMQDALSVSSLASQDFARELLLEGLIHPSSRIRDIAYDLTTSLEVLKPGHIGAIRAWLVEMAKQGRVAREETTVRAYLLRLDESYYLLEVMRFLKAVPYIHLLLGFAILSPIWMRFREEFSELFLTLLSFTLLLPFLIRAFLWSSFRNLLVVVSLICACAVMIYLWTRTNPDSIEYVYGYALLLTYSYAFMWPDFIYHRVALSGDFVKPIAWPIAVLLPLGLFPLTIIREGASISLGWFKARLSNIRQLRSERKLAPVFLGFVIILAIFVVFTWLMISRRLPMIVEMGIVIVPAIFFAVMAGGFFSWALRSAIEERRLLKATQKRKSKVSPLEYLQVVREHSALDSVFCIRYTRLIRERRLLETSNQSYSMLEKLAAQLQHDLLVEKEGLEPVTDLAHGTAEADAFMLWYISYLRRNKQRLNNPWRFLPPAKAELRYGISVLGWEMLDELNLLLDQVHDAKG